MLIDLAPMKKPYQTFILPLTLCFFALSSISNIRAEDEAAPQPQADNVSEAVVLDFNKDFASAFEAQLKTDFLNGGDKAVAKRVKTIAQDGALVSHLRDYSSSEAPKVIDLKVHPNRALALAYTNQRLAKLGMNVQFRPEFDATQNDPTNKKVPAWVKLFRYTAGAGVALTATAMTVHNTQAHDYLMLLLPTLSAGIASVLLEVQFASESLNRKFWSKVWSLGGPLGGRAINIGVNYTYGMLCYLAYVAGYNYAISHGIEFPAEAAPKDFGDASMQAFIGGLIFHLAFGQFQTDNSIEMNKRGTRDFDTFYANETVGVGINNGARVASWVVASPLWPNLAMATFFLFKTAPQVWDTHLGRGFEDKKIRKMLWGSKKGNGESYRAQKNCGDNLADAS
jgi:hypothetical protein